MAVSVLRNLQTFANEATDAPAAGQATSTLIMADSSVFHPLPNGAEGYVPPSRATGQASDYDSGFQAGQAQSDAVYQDTIRMMENVLDALKAQVSGMTDAIEASHGRVVTQCLTALLPDLSDINRIDKIKHIVMDAARGQISGPLTVRAHPNDPGLDTYRPFLEQANVPIEFDDTLPPSALQFTWPGGGYDIDPVKVVEACLSNLSTDTPTPIPSVK